MFRTRTQLHRFFLNIRGVQGPNPYVVVSCCIPEFVDRAMVLWLPHDSEGGCGPPQSSPSVDRTRWFWGTLLKQMMRCEKQCDAKLGCYKVRQIFGFVWKSSGQQFHGSKLHFPIFSIIFPYFQKLLNIFRAIVATVRFSTFGFPPWFNGDEATQAQIAVQQSPEKMEVQLPEIQSTAENGIPMDQWIPRVYHGVYHGVYHPFSNDSSVFHAIWWILEVSHGFRLTE